jgi:hypothetical protein
MKRIGTFVIPLVAALALTAPTAMAKQHGVSCAKIRAAIDAGKTQQEAAKDLKTSLDHVKHCSMQAQSKK